MNKSIISIVAVIGVGVFLFLGNSKNRSESNTANLGEAKERVSQKSIESRDGSTSRSDRVSDNDSKNLDELESLLDTDLSQAIQLIAKNETYHSLEHSPLVAEMLLERLKELDNSFQDISDLLTPLRSFDEIIGKVGNRLCAHWHRADPERLRDWMIEQTDSPIALATADWYGAYLAELQSPKKYADTIMGNADSVVGSKLLSHMLDSWISSKPDEALDFMDGYEDHPLFDAAMESYVYQNLDEDPETTMQWAEAISDTDMKRSAMIVAAASWREKDEQTFQKWYKRATASNPELATLLGSSRPLQSGQ